MQVPVATTGKLSSTLWETCDFIGNAGGMNLFLFFTAPCAVHSLLCSPTKDNGQRILLDLEDRDWLTTCSGHLRARKAKRILRSLTSKSMEWGIKMAKSKGILWVKERKSPIKVSFQIHFKSGERTEKGGNCISSV